MPKSARTWVFKILALLLPFVLLLFLELILRLSEYGHNLELFVQDKQNPDYLVANRYLSERYFTIAKNATIGNFEPFRKIKPKGTVRLFVLGESTTIGFPYMHNGSFHRWLKYRLLQMYPETEFEVINLSLTAVNSFTVRDIAMELAPYQPDAVLIYCGHNEYYGALGAASTGNVGHNAGIIRSIIKLKEFRVIQLLFNSYNAVFRRKSSNPDLRKTLMQRMAEDQKIYINSAVYKFGIKEFSENIDAVCQYFSNHHIPVLLSTIFSNEKDLKPFISDKEQTAQRLYERATNEYVAGKFNAAKIDFVQAKEHDLLRFRGPEEINRQIAIISKRYPMVSLVDSYRFFEKKSPHGIIDKYTILEHVHPNLNGYALLSEAFFQSLCQTAILNEHSATSMTLQGLTEQMPVTEADSCFGAYTIDLLRQQWPFNQKSLVLKPDNIPESIGYEMAAKGLAWNDAMNKLMTYYQQHNDTPKMLKVAEAVMLEYPTDPGFYTFAGKLCEKINDPARAINYFGRAFRIRPAMGLAQDLFLLEVKQEHLAKAMSYIDYGLTQEPGNGKLQDARHMLQKMRILSGSGVGTTIGAYKELSVYYDLLGAAAVAKKYRDLTANRR